MNFWDSYGWWTLAGLAVVPRFTLFVLFPWGGWLWWTGWALAPHLMVAILALPYWDQNPVLVCLAWFFALAGTGGEIGAAKRR